MADDVAGAGTPQVRAVMFVRRAPGTDFGDFLGVYRVHEIRVGPNGANTTRVGKVVAGDEDSYRYLVESIRRFPNAERFRAMIEDAGFHRVTFTQMTMGVAALHVGVKI